MNLIDSSIVKSYIENEIDYIKNYISCNSFWYNTDGELKDLKYLESLSEEDIENITMKINNDSELEEKINELIHYWLYHK